ncbi:hypothetical protein Cva_00848 [Caedimonas varicaedens]|uniref:Uncharacterized protein n=1 Tax=Caedimonas varicaedens TaxID=1629334 RepID=A0A0K8MCC2_9PROT|nr:hypothetical protein Cva_00848 [Caedimonas varicaedens]
MASIAINRQGLKELSHFNVNSQFCQQYGTQAFNFSGEITPQYQQICASFSEVIDDMMADMQALKKEIPVFGTK